MMNKLTFSFFLFLSLIYFIVCFKSIACPDYKIISATAKSFLEKKPGPGYPEITTLEDSYCAQKKYLSLLDQNLGIRVGYKAGLTNKLLQERFGAIEPVGGVLYKSMLLASGTTIRTDSGVRMVYEADLIVTVTDEKINDAKTKEEVIKYLGEIIPFIELLDILVAKEEPLNLATIIGYNVVSRYGVVGKGIPVENTSDFINSLENIESITLDNEGNEIQRAYGTDIMGHPLNVVLWLVKHVNKQGNRLKPGDILSLGAMGTFRPFEPGKTITVKYNGLSTGNSEAIVSFE